MESEACSNDSLVVRFEHPSDFDAIRQVVTAAFGQDGEARLIDALRTSGRLQLSLVAVRSGEVVGNIAFSRLLIVSEQGQEFAATALAPLAVRPDCQRQGIGSALVRAGLEGCSRTAQRAVIVLGEPAYYQRFGFKTAGDYGIQCPYPVPPEVFMAWELQPGALAGHGGLVRYAPEFSKL